MDQEVGGSNPPSCTSKISYLRGLDATQLPRKLDWEAYGKQRLFYMGAPTLGVAELEVGPTSEIARLGPLLGEFRELAWQAQRTPLSSREFR